MATWLDGISTLTALLRAAKAGTLPHAELQASYARIAALEARFASAG